MSILRLDLPANTAICDGKQLTFKAPSDDSTNISAIQIGATTYTLVDSNNQSFTSKFQQGAMLSVILSIDPANPRAYLLNHIERDIATSEEGTYTGTGSHGINNKNHITFSKPVKFFSVVDTSSATPRSFFSISLYEGSESEYSIPVYIGASLIFVKTSWTSATDVYWYQGTSTLYQLNESGHKYKWVAYY